MNLYLYMSFKQVGRDAGASVGAGDKGVGVIYSYSHSKGLYGGLALDGKVIVTRSDCNKKFYGKSVTCDEILRGDVDDKMLINKDYNQIIQLLNSNYDAGIAMDNGMDEALDRVKKRAIKQNRTFLLWRWNTVHVVLHGIFFRK